MRSALLLALALTPVVAGAQTVTEDFEGASGPLPAGWTTMYAPEGTDNGFDGDPHAGARSFRLRQPDPGEWAAIRYQVPDAVWADADSLHLTGWLRTDGVTGASNVAGYAGLWLRVDGPEPGEGRVLQFDNMRGRGPHGTTPWARYSVTLPVPKEAKAVYFGVLLNGGGTMWADDLELRVVQVDE